MPHTEHCVEVPSMYEGHAVNNNSRWAFVAEPVGPAPTGGWPVMIQVLAPNTTLHVVHILEQPLVVCFKLPAHSY